MTESVDSDGAVRPAARAFPVDQRLPVTMTPTIRAERGADGLLEHMGEPGDGGQTLELLHDHLLFRRGAIRCG